MTENMDMIQAYRRDLPGGGFVAIDIHLLNRLWRRRRFVGEVIVERRCRRRDDSRTPLVVASAVGDSVDEIVQVLLPAARCNETIAAALLRLSRPGAAPAVAARC